MLYIQSIAGNMCSVVDTDDSAVDTCTKDELKNIIKSNQG